MTAKDMLAAVLGRAELTNRERESFTDMWDRIHRFNRCSDKQRAWIEKVYFGQKLDRETPNREASTVKRRVVVPTWQRNEPVVAQPAPPPVSSISVVTRSTPIDGPGIVKTNARQIMLRRNKASGTFQIPSPNATVERSTSNEARRIAFINYPGVKREERVTSLGAFEEICPHIVPGSKQHQKVAGFFERGGVVLKVKPLDEARVA